MARARTLKPQFFRSEQVTALSSWARLLFAGLWTLADRRGVLEDRPKQIKLELFPADEVNVEELLVEIQGQSLIQRYSAEGRNCIWITGFVCNQNPHPREVDNGLPLPSAAESNGQPRKNTAANGRKPQTQSSDEDTSEPGKEMAGRGKLPLPSHSPLPIPHSPLPLASTAAPTKPCSEPEAKASNSPPPSGSDLAPVADSGTKGRMHGREPAPKPSDCCFPTFPTAAGKRTDARVWTLPDTLVSAWVEAFPAVDVLAECRRAHAWVIANLGRRKTASGMPEFLRKWLSKEQDRGGGRASGNGVKPNTRDDREEETARRAFSNR